MDCCLQSLTVGSFTASATNDVICLAGDWLLEMPNVIRIFPFNWVSQTLIVRNGSYFLNFQTSGGILALRGLLAKVPTSGEKRFHTVFVILLWIWKVHKLSAGSDVTENNSSPGWKNPLINPWRLQSRSSACLRSSKPGRNGAEPGQMLPAGLEPAYWDPTPPMTLREKQRV